MKDDKDRPHDEQDERNAFVLWRRHVDRQIGAAFNMLRDLGAPESHASRQDSSARQDLEELEKVIWARFEDVLAPSRTPTQPNDPNGDAERLPSPFWHKFERAFDRTMNPMRVQTERDEHEEDSRAGGIQEHNTSSVRDAQLAAGCPAAFAAEPQDVQGGHTSLHEQQSLWTRDGWGRAWTLDFFDKSPYSPIRLEQDMKKSDVNWRHAFEDLLLADAVDYEADAFNFLRGRDASLDRMSGRQWRDALLSSGLLHSPNMRQEPLIHSPIGLMHEVMSRLRGIPLSMPETELEFYERMSGPADGAQQSTTTPDDAVLDQAASETLAGLGYGKALPSTGTTAKKPSIISQVTTIEQHTQPDGSTTKKTVFKRRFSDGTEVTEEKHDATPPVRKPATVDGSFQGQDTLPQSAADKTGSWFSFWAD